MNMHSAKVQRRLRHRLGTWSLLLCTLVVQTTLEASAFSRKEQELYDELRRVQDQEDQRNQQIQADIEEKNRGREREDRELANLKQRLASCGRCAERSTLETRIREIEDRRRQAMIAQCAMVTSAMNSGDRISAMAMQGVGLPQQCREAGLDPASLQETEHRANLERLEARARSTGLTVDQFAVGEYYYRSIGSMSGGCPWYLSAAKQGHVPSVHGYIRVCAGLLSGAELERERDHVVRFVRACADRGDGPCTFVLARFQDPAYFRRGSEALMPANAEAALRLYERALSISPQNEKAYRTEIDRLNISLGLMAAPPEPPRQLGISSVVLRTGVYAISGAGYRGECVVRSLGDHRYSFEWRRQSLGNAIVPGLQRLESKVEGETITFVVDGIVRSYRLSDSPNGYRLVSSDPFERLTWQAALDATTASAPAPPEVNEPTPARSPRQERRCEQLARAAERARIQVERNPRYAPQAEKVIAEHRQNCND
jgi:hypothetical protein